MVSLLLVESAKQKKHSKKPPPETHNKYAPENGSENNFSAPKSLESLTSGKAY